MPEYIRGRPVPTQEEYNRRQVILGGFSAGAALLGSAGVLAAIREPIPRYETQGTPDVVSATPEPLPISTVEDEIVEDYRERYAIFGDTSQVDAVFINDPLELEIEMPRVFIKAAIEDTDWLKQDGFKWTAYGDYRNFIEVNYGDNASANIARELFNPYSYAPSPRFNAVREDRAKDMTDPDEMFAATITTWALYPEAFLDRFSQMPMVENYNDMNPEQPDTQPSYEKHLAIENSKRVLNLATALVKERRLEGDGMVNRKLASIAPRLWDIAFMFEGL